MEKSNTFAVLTEAVERYVNTEEYPKVEVIAKYAGQSNQTERDDEEQRIRTERAKRARDLEVGNDDSNDENIQNFLKAMRPAQEDLEELFDNVGDGENESEEKAE